MNELLHHAHIKTVNYRVHEIDTAALAYDKYTIINVKPHSQSAVGVYIKSQVLRDPWAGGASKRRDPPWSTPVPETHVSWRGVAYVVEMFALAYRLIV